MAADYLAAREQQDNKETRMGKPEGATTRLLRTTMDLELDEVNTKLIEAGEKAIDAGTLGKRRAWIKAKDGGSLKRSVPKKPLKKKLAKGKGIKAKSKAKGKVKATRKSPAPLTEPRPGTFGAFVYSLPYDLEVNEVVKRARAAGLSGQNAAVYKVRSKYPKPGAAKAVNLNPIATSASLREQDARKQQQTSSALNPVPPLSAREKHLSSARSQFVVLLMRLGLDDAEALLQDYKRAHDRLEATIEALKA